MQPRRRPGCVVLDWNAIAVTTLIGQGQSPIAQARFMAITQLAVFEAVNAIKGDYSPYLAVLKNYGLLALR